MVFNRKWYTGLLIIIVIYTLYYIYFFENKELKETPRILRHAIKLISSVSVYLIGTFHIQKFSVKWMEKLWHLIHLSMLGFLLSIGAFVWLISDIPYFLKQFTTTIQELLISPTLYIVMGLLNSLTLEKEQA